MIRHPRDGAAAAPVAFDAAGAAILLVHLAAAIASRSVAWPEITTPAYLWSRGWILYRDVKFLHTPGLIGLLALAFRIGGPQTWIVRAFAIAGPLAGHGFVLRYTRGIPLLRRVLVSAFFLVSVFVADGNAVWPVAAMAALSVPITVALTKESWWRAGLLIGAAILMKQTAAYVLAVVVLVLLARRSFRALVPLVMGASAPYAAALAAFAALGAASEMLRWTILVPFQVQEVTFAPSLFTLGVLGLALLPTAVAAALEKSPRVPSAAWLLAVGLGFLLLCYPNFLMLQTVAALPCLAVGAGRLLELVSVRLAPAVAAFLLVFTLSRGIVAAADATFDGTVLFWNDDPDLNAVVERLRRSPPETRVHSELWANVLPRSARLPPGHIWVHPWLRWYFEVENVRVRVLTAARAAGTIWVGYRSALPGGERIGAYAVEVVR